MSAGTDARLRSRRLIEVQGFALIRSAIRGLARTGFRAVPSSTRYLYVPTRPVEAQTKRFLSTVDRLQIIAEGMKDTIDGIEDRWVKVLLPSGEYGWCFGGSISPGGRSDGKRRSPAVMHRMTYCSHSHGVDASAGQGLVREAYLARRPVTGP